MNSRVGWTAGQQSKWMFYLVNVGLVVLLVVFNTDLTAKVVISHIFSLGKYGISMPLIGSVRV